MPEDGTLRVGLPVARRAQLDDSRLCPGLRQFSAASHVETATGAWKLGLLDASAAHLAIQTGTEIPVWPGNALMSMMRTPWQLVVVFSAHGSCCCPLSVWHWLAELD